MSDDRSGDRTPDDLKRRWLAGRDFSDLAEDARDVSAPGGRTEYGRFAGGPYEVVVDGRVVESSDRPRRRRFTVTLDADRVEELRRRAGPRSLSRFVDAALAAALGATKSEGAASLPDADTVTAVLDAIPGAWERTMAGRADAAAGRVLTLEEAFGAEPQAPGPKRERGRIARLIANAMVEPEPRRTRKAGRRGGTAALKRDLDAAFGPIPDDARAWAKEALDDSLDASRNDPDADVASGGAPSPGRDEGDDLP